MLAEERYNRIVGLLKAQKTATIADLCALLGTSESTIRRDLVYLDRQGALIKVHGGRDFQTGQRQRYGVV